MRSRLTSRDQSLHKRESCSDDGSKDDDGDDVAGKFPPWQNPTMMMTSMRRIAKKVLKPKICKRNCTNQQENLSIEIKWKYDILGLKKLTFQWKDLGGKSNKKLSMWIHPWSGSPTQLHLDRQLWKLIFTTLDFPSSRLFSMLWEVSISSNVTLTNSIPPSAPLYNNQPCIPHHRHPYTPAPITIRVTVSPLSLSLAGHYLVIKPSKLYPLYTRPIFNRPIFTLYSARFQSANFDAANQSIFTIFQFLMILKSESFNL